MIEPISDVPSTCDPSLHINVAFCSDCELMIAITPKVNESLPNPEEIGRVNKQIGLFPRMFFNRLICRFVSYWTAINLL